MIGFLEHRIFEDSLRLRIGKDIVVLHTRELEFIEVDICKTHHDDEEYSDRPECNENRESFLRCDMSGNHREYVAIK